MSKQGDGEIEQPPSTAICPNCGKTAIDAYDTGSPPFEFDCNNQNCRCEVFRANV